MEIRVDVQCCNRDSGVPNGLLEEKQERRMWALRVGGGQAKGLRQHVRKVIEMRNQVMLVDSINYRM
jgi:uncharacterized Fe-S cluster-containing radical SAM superfamily protein